MAHEPSEHSLDVAYGLPEFGMGGFAQKPQIPREQELVFHFTCRPHRNLEEGRSITD